MAGPALQIHCSATLRCSDADAMAAAPDAFRCCRHEHAARREMKPEPRRDPWRPTCSGGCQESSPSVPGAFPARRPSAPACLGWHGIAWAFVGGKDNRSPRRDILPRIQRVKGIVVAILFLWINLGAKCQTACKPGSVRTVLVRDGHSSRTRLAVRLTRPTRTTERECPCALRALPSLFGLAPGGVCPAAPVARGAVRSCRPVSPLPAGCHTALARAVCFLWHFPWGRPRRTLSGTVFPWSPDFPLPPCGDSGRPAV